MRIISPSQHRKTRISIAREQILTQSTVCEHVGLLSITILCVNHIGTQYGMNVPEGPFERSGVLY